MSAPLERVSRTSSGTYVRSQSRLHAGEIIEQCRMRGGACRTAQRRCSIHRGACKVVT
ncbi:MAG TPA: hypothetical protein VM580_34240 [Labilithrix sp.]|nr:hypothetical protein [Labilithrix sp.]